MTRRHRDQKDVAFFIVEALACYDSPETVTKAVKAEFDRLMAPEEIERYDPTKAAGHSLSDNFRTLFEETRKNFRTEIDNIPIAHKAVRLRILNRLVETAEKIGDIMLTAKLLQQAAKEVGGMYDGQAVAMSEQRSLGPRDPGKDHLAEIASRFGKGLLNFPEKPGSPKGGGQ